ncbi:MAG: 4Fe-4S dicluster domain-containing protein [Telluria sp.]
MSTDPQIELSALPGANRLARAAALAAAAALPDPDPVPSVAYRSEGRVLVAGSAADVAHWTEQLPPPLVASMVFVRSRADIEISGHLGAFAARWQNGSAVIEGQFDLVLDLCDPPLLARHSLPHGYYAPGPADEARAAAVAELAGMTGLFEKPKYFTYRPQRCGHARNRVTGCRACIDICSAEAIRSDGERIAVDPHLCAGCGACTTVCPSGALSYAYPTPAYTGERLRTLLAAYASAGGSGAIVAFHDASARALIEETALPDHVLALELQHVASVGIDVWLAALAYGAEGILVLCGPAIAPAYLQALREQAGLAQVVLHGLGYAGRHIVIADGEAGPLPRGEVPARRAAFHILPDKRNTLDFALAHLHAHAPQPVDMLPLPARAPFGAVAVDPGKCSLCMACVGACPSAALQDSPSLPRLSFIEANCIQCGLCVATCPEQAVALMPRLDFTPRKRQARVLHETEPFCCISCGKPFGTLLMVNTMLARLGQHPAFAAAPERLRMCGDCRVVDMLRAGRPTS